jgi:pyruvate,water dikinase
MMTAWLKTLDEIQGSDLPVVGGKAFNLATLRRHGLPVPAGLVVTTAFFEAQLRHHQFTPLWAGSPDVAVTENALVWLGDALKISPLADELLATLQQRVAEVFPEPGLFAVRSSAVDEDTRQHAFSGIHLTELGVPREVLPISIARCWASALSKTALQYRRQHGIPIQSIRLAVLLQPYIQPRAAGVAFTVNPVSGARDEMVIEAVPGHGKAAVDGTLTPARYRVRKNPPEYSLVEGNPLPPDNARPAREPTSAPAPLLPAQMRTLAEYLEQIEALMAAPQDVEWAIVDQGAPDGASFVFFQTRPVTVLPGTASSFDVEWSRASYREFLPDLPSPLCASMLERSQDQALSFFKRLGFQIEGCGPYLKTIYGRPYLNVTLARRLLSQGGVNPAGNLWIIGHAELSGEAGLAGGMDWAQMWAARRSIARLMLRSLRIKAWLRRFEQLAGRVRRSLADTDWRAASPADLLARFHLRIELASQLAEVDFLISAAAAASLALASQVLGYPGETARRAIRSAMDTDTKAHELRQGQRLLELARIGRSEQSAYRCLARRCDRYDDYRQALAGTRFLAEFDEFLAEYGHSAAFEADPGWPRYHEDPVPLLSAVAQMVGAGEAPDGARPARAGGRDELGDWPGWLAGRLIGRLRGLASLRGQLRALYGRSMTDCRAWDLKLADRWVKQGWLAQPEDHFWLTMQEVDRALMAEREVGPTLPALIRARRETYQTYTATEMPYALRESDIARLVPGLGLRGTALASILSGLPVSPGQVQGQVLVLRGPADPAQMKEGAILVTPSTDTTWFPLFLQARGLIIETGGLLSHGSIIAREFGVPAVANVPDATRRFQDGDLVLLDGSTGLIQILDAA